MSEYYIKYIPVPYPGTGYNKKIYFFSTGTCTNRRLLFIIHVGRVPAIFDTHNGDGDGTCINNRPLVFFL